MLDVSVNGRLRQIANNYGSVRNSLEKREFINTNSSISLLLWKDPTIDIRGYTFCVPIKSLGIFSPFFKAAEENNNSHFLSYIQVLKLVNQLQ